MKADLGDFQQAFLQNLLAANRRACSEIVQQLLQENVKVEEIYESVFKNALYEVGRLWEFNKITVADEHLATSVVEALMNELYAQLIADKRLGKKIVIACTENELHQVGVKMVADIFEMNGWDTFFLGSSVPTSELIRYIHQVQPDMVALSVSIYFHIPVLEKMITGIRNEFPEMFILAGGQAFNYGGKNVLKKYDRVVFLPDLKSIETFIKQINKNE